jgi:preprotein translocase subunit SecY
MSIAQAVSNVFKVEELKNRIFMTAFMLIIWRLGSHIPLPFVDYNELAKFDGQESKAFMSFFMMFSGGALANAALFSLGIMPYISASIIIQLLVKVFPTLEQLSKEGPSGQRKIGQYTRLLTVPIAIVQAIFITRYLGGVGASEGNPLVADAGMAFFLTSVLALTAGALFVMWLGEQITEYGLGNGASLLIMAGIVAQMPSAVGIASQMVSDGDLAIDKVAILLILYILVVFGIVYITQAQRRIPIQHAKHVRGRKVAGGHRHYLPLRVNQAGVMPVIFAASLLIVPQIVTAWITGEQQNMFDRGTFFYSLLYVVLVFFFSYFWTYLYFNPPEMSSQLKEYGSFVPGIRPGKRTSEFLEYVMNRITLAGAAFLTLIALVPDIVGWMLDMTNQGFLTSFLGGTGILIVVGVALDLVQKVESHLVMHNYPGFSDGGRTRGRRR